MKILAIDPSLTNTAVVLGDADGFEMQTFHADPIGSTAWGRIERYLSLVNAIEAWVGRQMPNAPAIFIEGYSHNSKFRAHELGEYGGLLRSRLFHPSNCYEVAPATLKKFATGSGKGPKDMIAAHLTKRYGVLLASNDEYDAYGLYRLGLVAEGLCEAANQAQREAVDTVLGRAKPKKSKKSPASK